MGVSLNTVDRAAGRIYTIFLALFTGVVCAVMVAFAIIGWIGSGFGGAWIWLTGALVFGFISWRSWRSKASLSDVDFTG